MGVQPIDQHVEDCRNDQQDASTKQSTKMWCDPINQDVTCVGKVPIKMYNVIHSYYALTAQSPIPCNCTYPKLRTDHPVLVYKTYKFM